MRGGVRGPFEGVDALGVQLLERGAQGVRVGACGDQADAVLAHELGHVRGGADDHTGARLDGLEELVGQAVLEVEGGGGEHDHRHVVVRDGLHQLCVGHRVAEGHRGHGRGPLLQLLDVAGLAGHQHEVQGDPLGALAQRVDHRLEPAVRPRHAGVQQPDRGGGGAGRAVLVGGGVGDDPHRHPELTLVLRGEPRGDRGRGVHARQAGAADPSLVRGDEPAPGPHVLLLARGVLVQVRVDPAARGEPQREREGVDVVGEDDVHRAPLPGERLPGGAHGAHVPVGAAVAAGQQVLLAAGPGAGVPGQVEMAHVRVRGRAEAHGRHLVPGREQFDLALHAGVAHELRERQDHQGGHRCPPPVSPASAACSAKAGTAATTSSKVPAATTAPSPM